MSAIDDYKKVQNKVEGGGTTLLPAHKSDDRTAAERAADLKRENAERKALRQRAVDLGLSSRGGSRSVERRVNERVASIGSFINKCLNKNRIGPIAARELGTRSSVTTTPSPVFGPSGGPKRPPQWFDVGSGAVTMPFQLFPFDTATPADPPNPPVWAFKVTPSTIGGELPDSPTPEADGTYLFSPSGTGEVWVAITIDDSTGVVTARSLESGASTPANSPPNYYERIGAYDFPGDPDAPTLSNYRYGPVHVLVCRNWFAFETPFYGVTFS